MDGMLVLICSVPITLARSIFTSLLKASSFVAYLEVIDSLTLFAIAVKLHTLGYAVGDNGSLGPRRAVAPSTIAKNIVGVL